MSQRLERLQREVMVLQRAVFRDEMPDPSQMPGPSAAAEEGGAAALTRDGALRLQSRLEALEQEVRNLTAQIEETRFELRRMSERFDTFEADVDLRLSDLEQGRAPASSQGQTGGRSRDGGPEAPAVEGLSAGAAGGVAGAASAGDESANGGESVEGREPRSLGQVSEDAVAALREEQRGQQGGGEPDASASPDTTLPDGSPEEQYRHAFGLLRETRYGEAEQALQAFLERHGDHELAGNAQYWLGETYYVRGNYNNAAVTFAEGFQEYPESGKAPDNLLKLGMSLGEIDRVEDACGIFAELQNRYPQAPSNILQRAEREEQRLGCSN